MDRRIEVGAGMLDDGAERLDDHLVEFVVGGQHEPQSDPGDDVGGGVRGVRDPRPWHVTTIGQSPRCEKPRCAFLIVA